MITTQDRLTPKTCVIGSEMDGSYMGAVMLQHVSKNGKKTHKAAAQTHGTNPNAMSNAEAIPHGDQEVPTTLHGERRMQTILPGGLKMLTLHGNRMTVKTGDGMSIGIVDTRSHPLTRR